MVSGVNVSTNSPSSWHQHLRGIFTGSTISIILFLSAMNVAVKFILAEANDLLLLCYRTPPVIKAFMDDLFLKLKNVDELQILLDWTSCLMK